MTGVPPSWHRRKVKNVCSLIVDCVNKTAPIVEQPTPYKMIRTTNVRGGRIDLSSCKYVNQDIFERWTRRAHVEVGDVILTREAPIGEVGYFQSDEHVFLGQRLMQYRADPKYLESRFLLYSFLSSDLQHQFGVHEGAGSVVSHIRVGDCSEFELNVPPLAEQRAIAHILGTLDDKIELNRRMNETLEAMARALFKDWFVDFGPVRAKAEGLAPPGLSPEIAALFPDALDDEDKPVGWEIATVGAHFKLTMGQSPPGETYNEEGQGIPFFQGRRDFGFRYPQNRVYCTAPTRFADEGDTLVSVRAPVGDVNMAHCHCCVGRGVAAVRHNSGSRSFSYYAMQELSEHFKQYEAHGTVFGSINKKQFSELQLVDPGAEVVSLFESAVHPFDEKLQINSQETEFLTQLRDTLLPKLMSGELRVREAERQVEAVL